MIGSYGVPFYGHLKEFNTNVNKLIYDMRTKYGPVFLIMLGGTPTVSKLSNSFSN